MARTSLLSGDCLRTRIWTGISLISDALREPFFPPPAMPGRSAQRHTEDERGENGADGGAGGAEAQIQQAHPGDLIGEARDAREEEKTYREDDDVSLV